MKKKKLMILIFIILFILSTLIYLFLNKKISCGKDISDSDDSYIYPYAEEKIIDLDNTINVEIYDNIKQNVSSKVSDIHYVQKADIKNNLMVVSDANLYADSKLERTYFNAKITNNSNEDSELLILFINFYENEESEDPFFSKEFHVDDFKKNTTRDIEIEAVYDFSNAYDFKILY